GARLAAEHRVGEISERVEADAEPRAGQPRRAAGGSVTEGAALRTNDGWRRWRNREEECDAVAPACRSRAAEPMATPLVLLERDVEPARGRQARRGDKPRRVLLVRGRKSKLAVARHVGQRELAVRHGRWAGRIRRVGREARVAGRVDV